MAVPESPAAAVTGLVSGRRILEQAVKLLVGHAGTADRHWRYGPLVILCACERGATAAVGDCLAARDDSIVRDGIGLDREIAAALADDHLDRLVTAFAACRIVVVDRLDRIPAGPRRDALVHLFDVATAAGAAWCVSTPSLMDDALGPALASRLAGGLVVAAPARYAVAAGTVPSMGRIQRAAARHHDVPVAALSGQSRERTVSAARSLAMYLARRLTGLSFQAIGTACGGRDHTTVLHGARVCAGHIERDPAYAADVERIVVDLVASGAVRSRRRPRVGSATLGRALKNRHTARRRRA